MKLYPYDIALLLKESGARTQEERAKVLAQFKEEDILIKLSKS